jgi:hypothetical protein
MKVSSGDNLSCNFTRYLTGPKTARQFQKEKTMTRTTNANSANTQSGVRVIHITDVRNVWEMFDEEVQTLIKESNIPVNFDLNKSLLDIGMMALKNVITKVDITFYIKETVVRRYTFRISDDELQAWGPPPGQAPLAQSFPDGTKVRISVTTRTDRKEEADKLLNQLGWTTGKPLTGGPATAYGTFVSGSYAWERTIYVNSSLDKGNRTV